MCSPVAIFALSGISTGVNYITQASQAKKAAKYQEQVSQATSDAVVKDTVRQFSQIGRRSVEETQRAAGTIQQITRDAQRARGDSAAGAAASGVDGSSVSTALRDFEAQELARIDATRADLTSTQENLNNTRSSVRAQVEQRIASSIGSPQQMPSAFNALFQIAGAAGNFWNQTKMIDPATGGWVDRKGT